MTTYFIEQTRDGSLNLERLQDELTAAGISHGGVTHDICGGTFVVNDIAAEDVALTTVLVGEHVVEEGG